jgi:hypothetical protein
MTSPPDTRSRVAKLSSAESIMSLSAIWSTTAFLPVCVVRTTYRLGLPCPCQQGFCPAKSSVTPNRQSERFSTLCPWAAGPFVLGLPPPFGVTCRCPGPDNFRRNEAWGMISSVGSERRAETVASAIVRKRVGR